MINVYNYLRVSRLEFNVYVAYVGFASAPTCLVF